MEKIKTFDFYLVLPYNIYLVTFCIIGIVPILTIILERRENGFKVNNSKKGGIIWEIPMK